MKMKAFIYVFKLFAIANLVLTPIVIMASTFDILKGSTYYVTTSSHFPVYGDLVGFPAGPSGFDTSVKRLGDCSLDLMDIGATCSVDIELTTLSLQGKADSNLLFRESLLNQTPSTGAMTIFSNGSGTGGTFDAVFKVFFDISVDGGLNWVESPVQGFQPSSSGSLWSIDPLGTIFNGLIGDTNANWHTGKDPTRQVDFFPVGIVHEHHPIGADQFLTVVTPISSSAWLFGSGLLGLLCCISKNPFQLRASRKMVCFSGYSQS
jgi:hypothetical protein